MIEIIQQITPGKYKDYIAKIGMNLEIRSLLAILESHMLSNNL